MKKTKIRNVKGYFGAEEFLYVFVSVAFSLIFLNLYTGGDQYHYTKFYHSVSSLTQLPEAFLLYRRSLSSTEPVYFLIVFFFSKIVSKNVFVIFFNALLACVFVRVRRKYALNFWGSLLVFSGFYTSVLFLAAERLKFGFLFFLIAFLWGKKVKLFFMAVSLLSHMQMFLMVGANFLCHFFAGIRPMARLKVSRAFLGTLGFLGVLMIIFLYKHDHIFRKLWGYSSGHGGFIEICKPTVFLLLTFFTAKDRSDRLESLCAHIPIIFFSALLGSFRLVIFSFYVYAFYACKKKRVGMIFFCVCFYFIVKNIFFLQRVILYGNGF